VLLSLLSGLLHARAYPVRPVRVIVPAGTPANVVARLIATTGKAMGRTDMGEKLAAIGADPESATPEQYGARIRADVEKWAKVICAASSAVSSTAFTSAN